MSRTGVLTAVILSLICGANIGLTQGVYVTASAGYSLGAAVQPLDMNGTQTGPNTYYEGVFGSYGAGLKFGASAGYMINKNLGAELAASYWLGNTFTATYTSSSLRKTRKRSASGIVVIPSIMVSANMETINPYARFGLLVGTLKVKAEVRYVEAGQIGEEYTAEETGNLAFGYAGALGVVVPASGAVDFFVEVALQSLNYSPKQSEITKYSIGGVDQLASFGNTVYRYEDSYESGPLFVGMSVRRPFNSIGIILGARINL